MRVCAGEGVTCLPPGELGTPWLIIVSLGTLETSGRIGEGIDFGSASTLWPRE